MTDFTADDILNKGQRPAGKGNTTRPSGQPVPSENTSVTAGQQGPAGGAEMTHGHKISGWGRFAVLRLSFSPRLALFRMSLA